MSTVRLTYKLGAFSRGYAKRSVTQYCIENGLGCRIEEVGGLLESLVTFEITGEQHKLNQAIPSIQRWMVS